jgi:intron-binding protein aquarius
MVAKKRRAAAATKKSPKKSKNDTLSTGTTTTATAAADDKNKHKIDFKMVNDIQHHLFIIHNDTTDHTSTLTTADKSVNKNNYLNRLEESGFVELKLWPFFLQSFESSSSENDDVQVALKQCAYLIALLVNQKNTCSSNVDHGPLSFLFHKVDEQDRVQEADNNNNEDNGTDGIKKNEAFQALLQHLLGYKSSSSSQKMIIETTKVQFLIIAYTSLLCTTTTSIGSNALLQMVGIGLWTFMPRRYRDLELKKMNTYKRKWSLYCINHDKEKKEKESTTQEDDHNTTIMESFIPNMIRLFLSTLNNLDSPLSSNTSSEEGDDDEETKDDVNDNDQKESQMKFLHISLQLLLDLLSTTATRRYLRPFLLSVNFSVKCTLSNIFRSYFKKSSSPAAATTITTTGTTTTSSIDKGSITLFLQLVTMLQDLETFGINDITAAPLSKQKLQSLYHDRAHVLQKIAHRHYQSEFAELIYAGVGMVCDYTFLKRILDQVIETHVLEDVAYRLRLMDVVTEKDNENVGDVINMEGNENKMRREFAIEVLLYHHALRPTEEQTLSGLPLYPDENLLWNPHLVPPGHTFMTSNMGKATAGSTTLALPKMNTQFLTFADYLLRSFKLLRLESAYEIRSDLVDVIKRMKPVPRHSYDNGIADDVAGGDEVWNIKRSKTEFQGWSRMGLELTDNLSCPVKILKVAPPKLGESIPSLVLAEITLDLRRCGEAIRKEWDEIGEFENLFMVAIDAAKMVGGPPPTMENDKQMPDEEDFTFPQRFGVVAVRGCMVLEVRDSEGNILSDSSKVFQKKTSNVHKVKGVKKVANFKRFLTVSLDPAQYAADATGSGSALGTKVYQMINVVIRRKAKENNFKAVLETVRGLMQGSASIDKSIPSWFQPVFLGYGNPTSAAYTSNIMKKFAMKTVGVASPDAALDYGDTFLNEKHLRESFPQGEVTVNGREIIDKSESKRLKYCIKVGNLSKDSNSPIMTATTYPFPDAANGNPVRFTPVQVEAIQSGINPGLTLIVGPPGTGKTDVAVQIIANLFHSFPTQRTVLVTHSNAALNDLFTKVMVRGDIDERYMLRLGGGERDLQSDSEFDFTKTGRVNHILTRRAKVLEEVQLISESLGISGAAERGQDGSPSYTCETAEYFHLHQVKKRIQQFHSNLKDHKDSSDVSRLFPFKRYFNLETNALTLEEARNKFDLINNYFLELEEYRPLELLRSQRQRTDYLLTKQARIVAMTCTHAAICRSHLVELGFQYDNILMEEAGQMLDIETFVPLLLQKGDTRSNHFDSRLKRICLIGDHHQLPPVIKNMSFSRYSNLDQSLFTRLIRLGVPSIDLDKQGRARPEIASLYNWRYKKLGNLDHVFNSSAFLKANAGFLHSHQLINVEDFDGQGESTPTAYFYQNVGEAEYAVALFQYMVLIGYPPEKISILTTYNGQKELLNDIISQRCGVDTPLSGIRPRAISTVDHYQGQQNDYIILSLVRTKSIGHLRDIRRLVVAVSRARLGLYIVCRQSLFAGCHELRNVFEQFNSKPTNLELLVGEQHPTERVIGSKVPKAKKYIVNDVVALGSIVHGLQEQLCK